MFMHYTNDELTNKFLGYGSGVYSQVTRQTNFLICGVSPDFTATEMALAYGVPILYEDDLIVWM